MTTRRIRGRVRRVLTVTALVAAVVGLAANPAVADPDVGDIEDQIDAESSDLEGIVEDYNAVTEELADTKEQIAELEEKLEPYKKELDELYDRSEPIVTTAYETHNMNGTLAILNAGSPDRFTDRMTALDGATSGDSAVIGAVVEAKSEYEGDLAALDDLKEQQAGQEADLEDTKDTIEEKIDRLQEDRKDAFRDDAASRGEQIDYIPEYIPGDRGTVVDHALSQQGKPYVWAAAGPDSYDCSGLILDAYAQVGISMPHNAAQQYNQGTHISRDQLQPGDSVYYNSLEHVAMYIGEDYVVHAPDIGDVVKIATLDGAATPYYGATSFL
ncbi:MAG: NlpC/P60 family protein [Stackebrandtia sp.]